MFKKRILACVLLVVCSIATAEESKPKGGYIGGGLGVSTFDDGGAFAGFSFDDEDTSFQIHGGYKFLKYFAVEARYVDFGTFSLSGLGIDASATSIHAVGIIPFAESGWELFGQLGFGIVNFDLSGLGDEDEDTVAGGIGIRYSPSQNFSLAIQTDVYVWEDTSLGPTFDLALGGTQLTIQYIF
jgi:hypothetical protein